MREPLGAFPLEPKLGDRRFEQLAHDVSLVLEQHAYPRVNGVDRVELDKVLFEFIYGSRGAAGELEKRINGTAAPLVDDEGKLDSYDCAAAAHELRRVKGAQGAVVLAVDDAGAVHIGCAVDPGSKADAVAEKVMAALIDAAGPGLQDVVLDMVVEEGGRVS